MTDTAKKRPDFDAYFVPDRENPYWTKIGAAWAHNDGNGFNIRFDLLPNSPGDIVLRVAKPNDAEGAEAPPST